MGGKKKNKKTKYGWQCCFLALVSLCSLQLIPLIDFTRWLSFFYLRYVFAFIKRKWKKKEREEKILPTNTFSLGKEFLVVLSWANELTLDILLNILMKVLLTSLLVLSLKIL